MNWKSHVIKQGRKLQKFLGLLSLCCLLVISCGEKPASQNRSPANERISIGSTLKLRTLDPADSYEQAASLWIHSLGDRLYTYEIGSTQLKPQLATEFPKISPDGLIYTIPLRQGVVFHDGTPFNAEAMAFSLRRFMQNQGNPSILLTDVVASVQATGTDELTITLKKPFAAFTALLTFPGLCAVSPKAYTLGAGQFQPNTFTGTGPYQLTQYGSDFLSLTPFEQYWGEKPANAGIDVQFFSSAANLYNAFTTGAVDIAYQDLDSEQIQSLEKGATRGQWQMVSAAGNYTSYWVLNTQKPPLNDRKIRQVLAAIVDRPLLVERVRAGQSEPLYSMIPTTFEVSQPAFQQIDIDINAAKAILKQAGYTAQNPLKLEIWYPASSNIRARVATTLKALAQQNLDGLLQLDIKNVESATAFDNLEKGIYQTFLLEWYPDFFEADNFIQPFLSCAEGSPTTGCRSGGSQTLGSFYYNPQMNQLIDQERQEQNPETRHRIFAQIQTLIAQDLPYIPLWQNKDYIFAGNSMTGVYLNPAQPLPLGTLQRN